MERDRRWEKLWRGDLDVFKFKAYFEKKLYTLFLLQIGLFASLARICHIMYLSSYVFVDTSYTWEILDCKSGPWSLCILFFLPIAVGHSTWRYGESLHYGNTICIALTLIIRIDTVDELSVTDCFHNITLQQWSGCRKENHCSPLLTTTWAPKTVSLCSVWGFWESAKANSEALDDSLKANWDPVSSEALFWFMLLIHCWSCCCFFLSISCGKVGSQRLTCGGVFGVALKAPSVPSEEGI